MHHENTIPSQLGPVDTIPSTLGPSSGSLPRRDTAPGGSGTVVKLLLLVAAVTLVAYLTR
jgi:hypothetical protein